jgi:hypothetical protein
MQVRRAGRYEKSHGRESWALSMYSTYIDCIGKGKEEEGNMREV